MKKKYLIIALILAYLPVYSSNYIECELTCTDSSIRKGFAKIPGMLDEIIFFKDTENSKRIEISNKSLLSILFFEGNERMYYERVLTYRNYGNRKPYESKSWLKVLKNSYMSCYLGEVAPMYNSPGMKLWYCKKANDTIAYFITMKYTGGMVFTMDVGKSTFKNNAAFYFQDYKELADKISNRTYKFDDLEAIVEEYNKWYETKQKN